MVLKNEIIKLMRENARIKIRLAYELNVSYPSIRRWIMENKPNGNLTTVKALKIISEELNVPRYDILEETQSVK